MVRWPQGTRSSRRPANEQGGVEGEGGGAQTEESDGVIGSEGGEEEAATEDEGGEEVGRVKR